MSIENAVVLLTSTELDKNKSFGSAFIIAHDATYSYLLTCTHVIEQINGRDFAGINKLKISGVDSLVEIVCYESSNSIDMALLKVKGLLDKPLFEQFIFGEEQSDIQIMGYSLFDIKTNQHIKRLLNGKLGKATKITANNYEYRFWDILIKDDSFSKLEGGYSGSPVYNENNQIIAVVSHRRTGELGHAFCISNLRILYPEIDNLLPNFKCLIKHIKRKIENNIEHDFISEQELSLNKIDINKFEEKSSLQKTNNFKNNKPYIYGVVTSKDIVSDKYIIEDINKKKYFCSYANLLTEGFRTLRKGDNVRFIADCSTNPFEASYILKTDEDYSFLYY